MLLIDVRMSKGKKSGSNRRKTCSFMGDLNEAAITGSFYERTTDFSKKHDSYMLLSYDSKPFEQFFQGICKKKLCGE